MCSGREPPNRDMKNKRRIHSAEFKARIALEAVKRHETVQQIAAENEVHPLQVNQWKSKMIESYPKLLLREWGRGRLPCV